MANLNSLPDLSTVDIQAIQDSVPILSRPLLPPLTTIAENWDTADPAERHLETNNDSCTDDDDEDSDDEEDQILSSPQKKVLCGKSRRCSSSSSSSSCSSSSSSSAAGDSHSDGSDSEVSDGSSDSDASSTSSDSDSDSVSSVSSCSTKSNSRQAGYAKAPPTFSVREANFDKGRVTLRLAALQLNKKRNNETQNVKASKPNEECARIKTKPQPVSHLLHYIHKNKVQYHLLTSHTHFFRLYRELKCAGNLRLLRARANQFQINHASWS